MSSRGSGANWNINPMNRGFIKPQKSVGTVLVNGRINKGLISRAHSNKVPYYPMATNEFRNDTALVSRGDIVYTIYNQSNFIECLSNDPNSSRADSSVVKGISSLNGQGHKNPEGNFILMSSIQVLGVAEMPNDDNGKEVYNILTGGIHTFRNNGNETIRVGDPIMAYAPSLDEIKKNTHGGRNTGEKNGVIKLWYKPYRPELHKLQLKQIYKCLTDTKGELPYLPAYKRLCTEFTDSVFGMWMGITKNVLPDLRTLLSKDLSDESILKEMLARIGHSEYRHLQNSPATTKVRTDIIKTLCVPFAVDEKFAACYIFKDNANETQKKLNDIQARSTSQYIETSAGFAGVVSNHVFMTAKSTATPGDDFSGQFHAYSKR